MGHGFTGMFVFFCRAIEDVHYQEICQEKYEYKQTFGLAQGRAGTCHHA
jgi:hypothetical protein